MIGYRIASIGSLVMALAALGHPMPACAQEQVTPSLTEPGIRQFDDPNLIYNAGPATRGAPLVVFMSGSGGRSAFAPRLLLETVAHQGYRVIYLTYDDVPSVSQMCPDQPPACSELFRRARIFGDDAGPVRNPRAEAIVPRLAALLAYLRRQHPQDGWDAYLAPDGSPAWPKIIISGLSQGAGMAAYIAKKFSVDRVVLFSSPWDVTGPDSRPAPWLYQPSATPPPRWWAERHARERTTAWIAQAYAALAIPVDHVMLFDGDAPSRAGRGNPYHTSTIRLPQYVAQWQALFGNAHDDLH